MHARMNLINYSRDSHAYRHGDANLMITSTLRGPRKWMPSGGLFVLSCGSLSGPQVGGEINSAIYQGSVIRKADFSTRQVRSLVGPDASPSELK
jgi:hypothetical protein